MRVFSKTGGVLYFEPLHFELNDCFGALKNVQPDSVFSNCSGMICHPNNSDNDDDDSNNTQSQATASSATEQKKEAKKKSKSNFLLYLATSQTLYKIFNLNNIYINLL